MRRKMVDSQTEKLSFQAEVKQLLQLVTHSLYSNKEIFLRELVSNASDALDRLRFLALADKALYDDGGGELKIWVDFDLKDKTITVRDNGIGMTREEVIENLGTIAKSGTREFLAAMASDKAKDLNLIGQFGVGFYASFVVSDKVTVKTRRAGTTSDQGVFWESTGEGDYSIQNINLPERGTEVVLHLKNDDHDFLDPWRLRQIITKYSDHIIWPVIMKKPEMKENTVELHEEEVVNRAKALWTMPRKDIKDEEYKELYKHLSHDFQEPLLWSHNHMEGKFDYITLLYLPSHAPFDLWYREKRYGLKLYVQRVFIMDDAEQLLPNYLRFVRGIVDSRDLPLNVSREILQSNKIIDNIRSGIIRRVLEMIEKLAEEEPEKFYKFWKEFGEVLKEGPAEDPQNKERIAKLFRFASTYDDQTEEKISLDDYIKRMKPNQEFIYYITADSFLSAKNSPQLEVFRKKGIEVLLLTGKVDEWMVVHFNEYQGKKLQSVSKGELDLSKIPTAEKEGEPKESEDKTTWDETIKKMKETLGEKVSEVRTTIRLTDSPTCLVTTENDMSLHLYRIMEAAGQKIPKTKPILEINPKHHLVKKLKTTSDSQQFSNLSTLLFEQAVLADGGKLDDPMMFIKRVNELLK
jgi:molecular chaperone HtpG